MLFLTDTITETGFQYTKWNGTDPPGAWHPELIVPPRIYDQGFQGTSSFFYIPPPYDAYCLFLTTYIIQWPGWKCEALTFDASNGQFKERFRIGYDLSSYLFSAEVSDMGMLFGCWNMPAYTITQFDWRQGKAVGAWKLVTNTWGQGNVAFKNAVINPQLGVILGGYSMDISLWNYNAKTQLRKWPLPFSLLDMAYESNSYCWVLMQNSRIIKLDWKDYKRNEMYSTIAPSQPEDISYKVAYDSLRQRLCIYRQKTDAEDGGARMQFEFYETVPKAYMITEPVPVSLPCKDGRTVFAANLIGDAGEGIGGQMIHAELVEPKNHGSIVSPDVVSEMNGIIRLQYQGPSSAPAEEELKLSTTISEEI